MKKLLLLILALGTLASCTNKVKISGKIGCAARQMVYLEYTGIYHSEVIDSVKANRNGKFKFRVKPSHYPDLYRVGLGRNFVVFSLDSASTDIDIVVPDSSFQLAQISGSEASADIQRLRLSHYNLKSYAYERNIQKVDSALAEHISLAESIILKDTRSMAAYYAINQTFNGNYYFNPYDKRGLQFWTAVATAFDMNFPDYDRSKELKTVVLDAIRQVRGYQLDPEKIIRSAEQTGFIEIELPDRRNNPTRLSSLIGNIVVIDFSAYTMDEAASHTMFLNEIYDAYHSKGLEIYQVSFDPNKLMWLEMTRNCRWVCVNDERSTESPYILTYNISEIPTLFLMDRQGNIVGRYNHLNIERAISELID